MLVAVASCRAPGFVSSVQGGVLSPFFFQNSKVAQRYFFLDFVFHSAFLFPPSFIATGVPLREWLFLLPLL